MSLSSAAGVQQGDPIGPLMFAACVHPFVLGLDIELREGPHADSESLSLLYLDDGVLCDSIEAVATGLKYKTGESAHLGLRFKISKSELAVPARRVSCDRSTFFPRRLLLGESGNDKVVWAGGLSFLELQSYLALFATPTLANAPSRPRSYWRRLAN